MFQDENTSLAVIDDPQQLAVLPVDLTPEVFAARIEREEQLRGVLKSYVQRNMKEGHHFSTKLGTQDLAKPMLLQEGCRNICSLLKLFFGEPKITEQWLDGDHYRVRVHISLHNAEGHQITSGDAICSTRETKYAYRVGQRLCPSCGVAAIFKDNKTQGGGWYCWSKRDGCGAKFAADAEAITSQQSGRVDNPDKADVENTVLKMAIKRAKSAAVCDVPMVSEIFAPEDDVKPVGGSQSAGGSRTSAPSRNQSAPQNSTPKTSAAVVDGSQVSAAADLAPLHKEIEALIVAKVGDTSEDREGYLKGRDPYVMPQAALERMKGDLEAM